MSEIDSDAETISIASVDDTSERSLNSSWSLRTSTESDLETDVDSLADASLQNEDLHTSEIIFSDDDENESESNLESESMKSELIGKGLNNVVNATRSSLTVFVDFITDQWPSGNDSKALEVLELQLKYGGGFCAEMERFDLSTPPHVRLDMDKVLSFLSHKTNTSAVKKLEKFVLPNIEILESGDVVMKLLGDYCGALGGTVTVTTIDELLLHCDQISDNFVAGDLHRIKTLCNLHQISRISVHVRDCKDPTESTNDDFKKFYSALCKRQRKKEKQKYDYDRSDFLKKRPAPSDDIEGKSKRCRKDTDLNASSDMTDDFIETSMKDNGPVNLSHNSILWTCYKTNQLHERGITGDGVTTAIIDSGIYIGHEAFLDREETEKRHKQHCSACMLLTRVIAINDMTCNGNIDLTNDHYGHGTMCASIVCGTSFIFVDPRTKRSIRIPAGVAPKAKIVMYKVTGSSGQAHTDMVVKALNQCIEDKDLFGIDIVLLPNGSKYQNIKQDKAIRKLADAGILVVTAPGNSGKRQNMSYPAASGNTICVGSHDVYCNTTSYTTKGRALDFTAPGEGLVGASSAHPTAITAGYRGTSYAASCFAGLLALIIQYVRTCSDKDLKKLGVLDVQPSLEEVLHDHVAMKRLLQRYSKYCHTHTEENGYGHIDTKELFNSTPIDLIKTLYKDLFSA